MTKHIYKHIYSFLLAAAFLFGGAGILSAQEIEWSKVPNSFSYDIRWGSITHGYNNLGQDLFIVFGYDSEHDQDVISTSKDGLNWTTPLNPQSEEDPSQVSWGSAIYSKEKGLFVAVGKGYYDQTGYVMTSEDGESWLINEDAKTENIYWSSVTYGYDDDGDGLFVAVGRTSGDSGVSMTSTNGIAWSDPQVIEGQAELFSVTYSKEKGLFVAAGGYSGNQISTSNDGLNWEIQETPEPFGSAWMSVTYSKEKGLFVAVGYRYSNPTFYGMVMTSEDGKN
ncbi:MAG: hypothetical protein PHC89_02515 [Candidatus Pacebacteria bacterium]|nr:hypothetical protein [Candidatus Paceibacterota bacterium]